MGGGNFIDRLLSSNISFRLPHVSAGGIINGASKNDNAFKPVGSFGPMVWDAAYGSGVRRESECKHTRATCNN